MNAPGRFMLGGPHGRPSQLRRDPADWRHHGAAPPAPEAAARPAPRPGTTAGGVPAGAPPVGEEAWPLDRQLVRDPGLLRRRLLEGGLHKHLVETVIYWAGLHRRDLPPARADIDPAEIRALLPSLALLDDQTGDGQARFRLAGTGVVELLGCEPTGRRVAAVASPLQSFLLRCWTALSAAAPAAAPAAAGAVPSAISPDGPLGWISTCRDEGGSGLYQYEGAFLPLSDCFAPQSDPGNARVLVCLLRRFLSDAQSASPLHLVSRRPSD